MVSVHYKGQLLDGTVFDSSYKRRQPIDFNLGIGQVIAGWDEGIQLLQVGDKARFVIPSNLAYGERGAGGVAAGGHNEHVGAATRQRQHFPSLKHAQRPAA